MRTYRIRILNGTGQTARGRDFICEDDAGALALALRMLGSDGRAEVWLDSTLVGVLPPNDIDHQDEHRPPGSEAARPLR